MKKLLFIPFTIALLLSCATNAYTNKSQKTASSHKKDKSVDIPKADKELITMDVTFLASDELKGRNTGSKGIATAANYIQERFKNLDIAPYKGTYRDPFMAQDKQAFNVVGVLPGNDPTLKDEIVVLGAHYDHIGMIAAVANDSIANGANDNASGTATVLAMAQSLKKLRNNRRTVVFALFSAEEIGLLGSKHLAQRMKKEGENVVAVLNFEMTGVPMKDHPFLTYVTGHDTSNMAQVFNQANPKLVVTGKLEQAAQFQLFKRSDNYPFYKEFNVPSQTFCTFDFTNFDHYHKVDDEFSEIDVHHMARVVDELMPGVIQVINGKKLEMQ